MVSLVYCVGVSTALAMVAAIILFLVSKKFYVYEDPRVDLVEGLLPSANCGACGFIGCRSLAEEIVNKMEIGNLACPVGGNDTMISIGASLGLQYEEKERMVAVKRCNAIKGFAKPKFHYEASNNCQLAHYLSGGETGCEYGCLGMGQCISVCDFGALTEDPDNGLPVVDDQKCTACGACVEVCPRNLFELRPYGPGGKRVYVACMNKEKGAIAKKNCDVACIGCKKCEKVAGPDDVKVTNFLSYIKPDIDVDTYGPDLIAVCPTHTILGVRVEPKPETQMEKEPPDKKVTDQTG